MHENADNHLRKLFYTLAATNYTSTFDAPFSITANSSSGGSDASVISALEALDVYAQLDFVPRRDLVNGTAPPSDWHYGPNAPATNATTPFFIAKGRGPQYINGASGYWQVVSPFITPTQSAGNFTQGTITLSKTFSNATAAPIHTLTTHTALEVIEGALTVSMEGQVLQLTTGDVAFVPSGTPFSYWSTIAYTNVLYIGGGSDTLDQQLIKAGQAWSYPLFPSGTTLP
jgi:quercetin dioxygenase-like cupin family protein